MKGRASLRLLFAILVGALVLVSTISSPLVTAASTTTTTTSSTATQSVGPPTSLVLSVVPSKLPADGGSYPAVVVSLLGSSGTASLSLNSTTVFLTSSQEGVGTIESEVTIAGGSAFAVATFTTSTTPGQTTISASSVGLAAASTTVTTVTPSGFATRLSVIPVPSAQLANAQGQGTVIIETLDSLGFPAQTSSTVTVTLSSSNNDIVSLPSSLVTIPSGSVLSSVSYNVGATPGTATITGSASGFNSASGTVNVEGASPYAIEMLAQPNPISTSSSGRLVVTLIDQAGNPAPAPSPVTVSISSANTSEIYLPVLTVNIPAGQIYAVTQFNSGSSPGIANLTASSSGLVSYFASVKVFKPAAPVRLELLAAPNPILADEGQYDSIVVALTNSSDGPAVATSSISVTLSSSNSAVGQVVSQLTIPEGSSYAIASFTSTYFVGNTSITASAQNLESAALVLKSYGPIPAKVVVQALPDTLPADGGAYSALEVILESATGSPATAPQDVPVQLTSSNTAIVAVNSSVVIAAGQSYALTTATTTISQGTANVTATSSGFSSSSTGFTTVSPAPSQLGLYIAPASGIKSLGKTGDAVVAVQLQDSHSNPADARQTTDVTVTSSSSSMVPAAVQLSIPLGSDCAWAILNTSESGSTTLTASTSGLASSSIGLFEASVPVSVTLTAAAPTAAEGTTVGVQVQLEVLGSPVGGANVTLTATSGVMTVPTGTTDSSGQFSSTFVAETPGLATITAVVQDPSFGNQTATTPVLVTPPGTSTSSGASRLGILSDLLPVLIVAVVIVIVVVGVRRVMNKRRAAIGEEGEPPRDTE